MRFNPKLTLFSVLLALFTASSGQHLHSSARFYVSTDKSFSSQEFPYLHLEGEGSAAYEVRVYAVPEPLEFLRSEVEERLLKEKKQDVQANPVELFLTSWGFFKQELRQLAREELPVSRKYLQQSIGLDYEPHASKSIASLAPLPYPQLTSFSLPPIEAGWSYRKVDLPVAEPGCYLVEVVKNGMSAKTLIIKSDLTFIAKQSSAQTVLFTANKDTGQPQPGVNVFIYDRQTGKVTEAGASNKEGIFRGKKQTAAQSLIIAEKQGQLALSDPDFFSRSFYGDGGLRAYMYTDRSVYKPGNLINYKGIVREFRRGFYRIQGLQGEVHIEDSRGKMIGSATQLRLNNSYGTFDGSFQLPNKLSSLGKYRLVFSASGNRFSSSFFVENFQKPSFEVSVQVPQKVYVSGEEIPVNIQAAYLYGAPLGLKKVSLRLFRSARYSYSPVGSIGYLENADQYLASRKYADNELVLEKKLQLDEQGTLKFTIPQQTVDKDYDYRLVVNVNDGRAQIAAQQAFQVTRGKFYLQVARSKIVYQPTEKLSINAHIIPFGSNVNSQKDVKLTAKLFRREFKAISMEAGGEKVSERQAKSKDLSARFQFPAQTPGHYSVVVSGEDASGKSIEAVSTLWISGKASQLDNTFPTLNLQPDKDVYSPGDKAKILLTSPVSAGTLFYTLENQKIIESNILQITANSMLLEVPIRASMAPNFSLSASLISGGTTYRKDIRIIAPPRQSFLAVNVKTDKREYQPKDEVILNINVENFRGKGEVAEVSVAVVDDAIFQVRPDINPSLGNYFYHPRRNNVITTLSDSYRFFGYSSNEELKLAKALDGSLPLAGLKSGGLDKRSEFQDTALWKATVITDSAGKAQLRFKLPDNLTRWRVTAKAVTSRLAVGQAQTKFLSKKDLMMIVQAPEYLYQEEKAKLPLLVANRTNKPFEATVALDIKNGEVSNKKSITLQLAAGSQKTAYFDVMPGSKESVTLNWQATAGQLSDNIQKTIPLKPFGQERSISKTMFVQSNSSGVASVLPVPEKAEQLNLSMIVSPGVGLPLKSSLAFLADYPYGCIEQTMSRFVPLLAAKQAGFISKRLENELPDMIEKGLENIKRQQNFRDGGFRWMAESGKSDPLMSAYVHYSLARASKLTDLNLKSLLRSSRSYLLDVYQNQPELSASARAYILLALAESGKIKGSMVESLAKENTVHPALISNLFMQVENKQEAKNHMEQGIAQLTSLKTKLASAEPDIEQDPIEEAAWLLIAAVRAGADDTELDALSAFLLENRRGLAWDNSRNSAMAVLALSDLLISRKEQLADVNFEFALNGTPGEQVELKVQDLYEREIVQKLNSASLNPGKNDFKFLRNAGMDFYATLVLSYFDSSREFSGVFEGFKVKRNYYRLYSESSDSGKVEFKAEKTQTFEMGDLVMVEISVESNEPFPYIQVEDPVLSGFAPIRDDALYYSERTPLEYQQRTRFQDTMTFFREYQTDSFTVRYFLNAVYPGEHSVLPAKAMLMYYPHVYGTSPSAKLKITEKKS